MKKKLIQTLISRLMQEEDASLNSLHLTGYENRMSKLAESFLKSPLSYRYLFGTFKEHGMSEVGIKDERFMYRGMPGVYGLEKEALRATKKMFHSASTDFRPTSGLHAILCTLLSTTEPGDIVYSIDSADGGHFATRHVVTRLGRKSLFIPWDLKNLTIDLDAFKKVIKKYPPKVILFEHGTPLFNLPVKQIRQLVGENVVIVYDGSHTLGLIAGGEFQNPLEEGCDILQGNTHKTFPGPQKAIINFRNTKIALDVTNSISKGLLSSPHTHHLIAEYITILEMERFAKEYAKQMIKNGKRLAESLAAEGFDLVHKNGIFTTSHELLLTGEKIGGYLNACKKLLHCGINTNARIAMRQGVVRVGVQEVTRRGMKEGEMEYIAKLFKRVLLDNAPIEKVKKDVVAFNKLFQNIHYSFDKEFGLWKEAYDTNQSWWRETN